MDLINFLKNKGYEVVENVTKKILVFDEEIEIFANAIAKKGDLNFVMVRREEDKRPLVPLERFIIAIARLFEVKGFAIATNGEEVVCLRVDNGERVDLNSIPEIDKAKAFEFKFDRDAEKRIVVAIGKLRCPCRCDECRI